MKVIKENKWLIIFAIAVVMAYTMWCNHVEKTNDQMNAVKTEERS